MPDDQAVPTALKSRIPYDHSGANRNHALIAICLTVGKNRSGATGGTVLGTAGLRLCAICWVILRQWPRRWWFYQCI